MSARSAAGPALEALWSRTKTKSPQTNGIAERFHKTVLDEFYRIAFRKRLYASIGDRPPPRRRAGLPPLAS
jgi:transposase InsO family protein